MPSCTKPRRRLRSKTSRPEKRRRVTKRKFWNASGAVPTDVHQRITDTIQAQLLKGTVPWINGIIGGGTLKIPKRHSGEAYRGINIPLLWCAQMEHGFTSPNWMTYRQAAELGAHVRKGEHGSLVVYTNTYRKKDEE